jgi:DNA-binding transcriptional LysR family regulator
MDRFASITAFVRVAGSGGFSAAGRRLNLSKATVSDQIQALENALGVRLLNRITRRVSLTEIGRGYYDRCVQLLQDLEEADEAAGAQQATPRGQLRVYCQQGVGRFAAPVVTDFLARYPEASVDLRTGPTMIDLMQEACDLGIGPLPPPDATLVRRRLGTLSLMVCGGPGLPRKAPSAALPGRPRRP